MITLHRTNSDNPDFIELVRQLDAYLAECDGEDHAFYGQFNKILNLRHVLLAYDGQVAVGCGAIREFSVEAMEVKRMYVLPEARQRGIASMILEALEQWASELGYAETVLETGRRLPEAVRLYEGKGYERIPNYGQYAGVTNSICFRKKLR
jgi:GNAT superfamily N-acetyltransferase